MASIAGLERDLVGQFILGCHEELGGDFLPRLDGAGAARERMLRIAGIGLHEGEGDGDVARGGIRRVDAVRGESEGDRGPIVDVDRLRQVKSDTEVRQPQRDSDRSALSAAIDELAAPVPSLPVTDIAAITGAWIIGRMYGCHRERLRGARSP